MVTITDDQFDIEVLQANRPVMVYFWAPWCGPCRLMSPVVEGLANVYSDRLKVVKMEVDPNPNSVAQCNVEGVPALVLFREGQPLEMVEGAISKAKLENLLGEHFPN